MSATLPNICVMLSGSGRTLENLLAHIDRGRLPARISLVIASRPCRGEEIARSRGVETLIIPGVIPAETLARILREHDIDWLVLAGYLKYVNIPRAPRLTGRVVNIHPALLPKFGGPGMFGRHVHEAVISAREKESGCTVHLCGDEYDRGPIVLQKRCPVLPDDTPGTLAARVFALECEAYPEALNLLLSGAPSPASSAPSTPR